MNSGRDRTTAVGFTIQMENIANITTEPALSPARFLANIQKVDLPDELFLLFFDLQESKNLLSFAKGVIEIANAITRFNVIRTRASMLLPERRQ